MGAKAVTDQPFLEPGRRERNHGNQNIPCSVPDTHLIPMPTLPIRYRNGHKPSLVVEVVAAEAEFRVGENRWISVIYRRLDNGRLYARPKAEFLAKFAPVEEK